MKMADTRERTEEERQAARERMKANLMPVDELNASMTPEQRRENARKAGLASAEARKRRKTAQEIYAYMLGLIFRKTPPITMLCLRGCCSEDRQAT